MDFLASRSKISGISSIAQIRTGHSAIVGRLSTTIASVFFFFFLFCMSCPLLSPYSYHDVWVKRRHTRVPLISFDTCIHLTDLPAGMASLIVFGDDQLIFDLLLQFRHMRNNTDQFLAFCHVLEDFYCLISGMFIQ